MSTRGAIAAGHPRTAESGADALRAGGNAVDAAVAAVLASLSAEPGLTALGGGGYMLVSPPGQDAVLLDFFVEAPGRGADPSARTELTPVGVTFGEVLQIFNAGPASVGTYGLPAGLCEATRRFGALPLADLAGPAARLAREGVALNAQQAYVVELLEPILRSTPECAAIFAPGDRLLREGDLVRQPELAEGIERLGREGDEPFYRGDVADAVAAWLDERGGMLTRQDLAAYRAVDRAPIPVAYRDREVLLNPPPSAGGILIAHALALLEAQPGSPSPVRLVAAMEEAQGVRTAQFLSGLAEEGFLERFLRAGGGARSHGPGSTTHISVLDAEGLACSVTCSNGEGSGLVVPGTGLHLNNMLGEQDLNPLGFHRHPPGRRMPSMMCPTVVRRGGAAEIVLGSAGSNRIRSAILQTVLGVVDRGLDVEAAVHAPRLHFEEGVVYAEPGAELEGVEALGHAISRFSEPNLFFGGAQAVARDAVTGRLRGGGDPRRGGSVVVV